MKGKDKYLKVLEVLMIAFCFVFKIRAFHFKVYNQQGEQQEKKNW